jgi:hypothetical protein
VLGWYEPGAAAPADFHARWRPPGDDSTAEPLLVALRRIVAAQAEAMVAALAAAIDAFLGHELPAAKYEAPAVADWMEARLYGLTDWRPPAFAKAGAA